MTEQNGAGVEKAAITTEHILSGLEERYPLPRWVTVRELPNATAWKAARRIDLFAIGAWPSEGFDTVAFEVKVSRADFLRDMKDPTKQRFSRLMASNFYFATVAGIVKPGELPDWAGLVEFDPADEDPYRRRAGKFVVPAPELPRMHPTWPFVACLTRLMAKRASKATLTTGGTDGR